MTCGAVPLSLAGRGIPRAIFAAGCCSQPLAGVSDRLFRGLVRRLSAGALLFTEMVNATSLEMGRGLQKLAELELEPDPIGVQLLITGPSRWPRRRQGVRKRQARF